MTGVCKEGSGDNVCVQKTRCEFSVRTVKGMEEEGTRKSTLVEHILCMHRGLCKPL